MPISINAYSNHAHFFQERLLNIPNKFKRNPVSSFPDILLLVKVDNWYKLIILMYFDYLDVGAKGNDKGSSNHHQTILRGSWVHTKFHVNLTSGCSDFLLCNKTLDGWRVTLASLGPATSGTKRLEDRNVRHMTMELHTSFERLT